MALILRYFTEFRSFPGALHKSGWRFRRKKVHVRYLISRWVSCYNRQATFREITGKSTITLFDSVSSDTAAAVADTNPTIIINYKWLKCFEERPHRVGDFSSGKFNVTLDCFCGRPIGMLDDSMRGNPDVRATGIGGVQENPDVISPQKYPFPCGPWTPSNT